MELVSLISTSRLIYDIALPAFLRNISIAHPQRIEGLDNLLRRLPTAGRHIRSFVIWESWQLEPDSEPEWSLDLCFLTAKFIKSCPHLDMLVLTASSDVFDALASTAANPPGLSTLLMWHTLKLPQRAGAQWLSTLQAPLRTIELVLGQAESARALEVLANFSGTLEELTLQGADLSRWSEGQVWPRVRQLSLETSLTLVEVAERAFPNVCAVNVTNTLDHERWNDLHLANTRHKCVHWRSLARVTGDLIGIPGLVLNGCQVDRLNVRFPLDHAQNLAQVTLLERVLQDIHPQFLHLELKGGGRHWAIASVVELLPDLCGLKINVHAGDYYSDLEFLVSLVFFGRTEVDIPLTPQDMLPLASFTGLKTLELWMIRGRHTFSLYPRDAQHIYATGLLKAVPTLESVTTWWTGAGWERRSFHRTEDKST